MPSGQGSKRPLRRPGSEVRGTIEAIIWRIDNGAKWRSIPSELVDWHHPYLQFRRWAVRGVWGKIMAHLVAQAEPRLAFACMYRRYHLPRASEGIRRTARQGCEQRPGLSLRFIRGVASRDEALGRSGGGLGTKIVGVCDAAGRLVDFVRTPGQAHELAPSLRLLHRLPNAPFWVLADMAFDARAFCSDVRAMNAIAVVPSRRGTKQPEPCPTYVYQHRNLIERCW
ncbi:MAG: IS5 family transposase [Alphaproteobacteria bacterium]|nr:MAG: IS5 family transposase [Alphaproteobacteria bacterium]